MSANQEEEDAYLLAYGCAGEAEAARMVMERLAAQLQDSVLFPLDIQNTVSQGRRI